MRKLLPFLAMVAMASAQQPNTVQSSLRVNGQDGPPWPVTGAVIPIGVTNTIRIDGAPGAPFQAAVASSLVSSGVATPFGVLHLPMTSPMTIIADGLVDPSFAVGPAGTLLLPVSVPQSSPVGTGIAVQGLVLDPTAPAYATLTAASDCTTQVGATTTPLTSLSAFLDFSTYGFTFSFYGTSYTGVFVNDYGQLTFGTADADFTPTPPEMLAGPPRIAPFWANLSPGIGTVTAVGGPVVAGTPFGGLTITWDSTAQFSGTYTGPAGGGTPGGAGGIGGGAPGSVVGGGGVPPVGGAPGGVAVPPVGGGNLFQGFSVTLVGLLGDVLMTHGSFNAQPIGTVMVGISPGGVLGAVPQTDLSLLPFAPVSGTALQPIYEWFGLTGMPFYTLPASNPYDLPGASVSFLDLGGGAYFGT